MRAMRCGTLENAENNFESPKQSHIHKFVLSIGKFVSQISESE